MIDAYDVLEDLRDALSDLREATEESIATDRRAGDLRAVVEDARRRFETLADRAGAFNVALADDAKAGDLRRIFMKEESNAGRHIVI